MKKRVLHLSPLFTLATCFLALLCLPSVSSASSPPADSVHFCVPFDYEQWEREHPRPATKPLGALNAGEPRTVRLIYFFPNDRTPQQDIDAKMDEVMKNVQLSYEEVMEYHGFGRRTFTLETDATGKAVVHHVRGKFNDEYYHTDTFNKVIYEETAEQFDPSANIYLVVLDVIDSPCGLGGSFGPEGGVGLISASCFNVFVAAHELGHAFGLAHDHFRNATRSPSSYHTDWMVTSFCAAEWLDAHRYFNMGQTYPQEDEPTTIQMLPPLAVPPYAIRLRFEVTDPDGLHQAQLHNHWGDAIDCQGISSESASVEFVTLEVTEDPGNRVRLRVVDVYGNVTEQWRTIDITELLPPEIVSIPDANLASLVREALDLTPADAISQLDMLRLDGLEASRRQITDLTGLEHAVNLKGLSLGENQIRDITPLAGSTILESLDLTSNNISDLSPLAKLTNLTHLWLPDNNISDLSPLAGLTNLSTLEFNSNSVSDLSPLVRLTNLSTLEFNSNSVSDLSPLVGLPHLAFLSLVGNSVSDLSPLAKLTNLTDLWLHDNNISDLSPLVRLTNLSQLGFDDNSVSDLSPLIGLPHLAFIALVSNSVSDLSPLVGLPHLGELYLWDNPLSYPSINTHILALQSRGVTIEFDTRTPTSVKISGDGQVGTPGSVLTEPLGVEVQDENEVGFEGVPVAFAVTAGGGTLSASTDTTDAKGRAQTTLTLGRDPGTNTVEVTVAGIEQPVTFVGEALATPDFNGDGIVGFADFVQFAAQFGLRQGDAGYEARYDLDEDGMIGFGDFVIFANAFGKDVSSN